MPALPLEPTLQAVPLQRDPAGVATPLAIALTDFCRRAGRLAPPDDVRRALARLTPGDDARLARLLEKAPAAKPLGPEAAIDLFLGLPASEASSREESGFYVALGRLPRLAPMPLIVPVGSSGSTEAPTLPPPKKRRASNDKAAKSAIDPEELPDHEEDEQEEEAPDEAPAAAPAKAVRPRLRSERAAIAPTVRAAGTPRPERPKPAPAPELPRRGAQRAPRGRMMVGPAALRDVRELEGSRGKEELRAQLGSFKGHLPAIADLLARQYAFGDRGFTEGQLERLLRRHGLEQEARTIERDHLRELFTTLRGDLFGVAKRLGMPRKAFEARLVTRGLWEDAERIRDRFRREPFSKPASERAHLLLHRMSWLRDLGIAEKLEAHLRVDFDLHWKDVSDLPEEQRFQQLAKRLTVDEETARALVERMNQPPAKPERA